MAYVTIKKIFKGCYINKYYENCDKVLVIEVWGSVITREEVKRICKRFRVNHVNTINFMISYGYFIRILRGLYYVKTIEEFKLKRFIDPYWIISSGLNKLGVNWYFGPYTALRFNGLTHEFLGQSSWRTIRFTGLKK